MARTWTPMQRKAIDTRDRTLLVSAAAGSGKTATLTERIIASILDGDDPIGIEDMLIVTFTRAAVGELRERISAAIKDAIASFPTDERLLRQLYLLPSAKISTIDSFCATILRENADRVGVNPTFRIADTAEAAILAESILDGLISAIYDGYLPEVSTAEEFDRLADCMTDTRSEGDLASIILLLYNSTLSTLDGVGSIASLVYEYDPDKFTDVSATHYGRYAITHLHEAVSYYRDAFFGTVCEIEERASSKNDELYSVLLSDIEFFDRLLSLDNYEEIRDTVSAHAFPDTPRRKEPEFSLITPLRAAMKKDILDRYEKHFSFDKEDWRVAYTSLFREFGTLLRVLTKFDRLFREEKLRRNMLEYSDVERFTYECLWQDGRPTDIAEAQKKLYRAVYIDEYQDVNSLQNKIFEAVSREDNRFMVGDIKQSIYGFRSANADIFASMKQSFLPIDESAPGTSAAIFMSNNFRCDKGVIDFVNDIFDKLFYRLRDSIGYVEGDRLVYSKRYEHPEPEYAYPEICIATADDYPDIEDEDMIVPFTVANKIKTLLESGTLDDGSPVTPGKIAIIMRNAKGREGLYKAALDALGIPSATAPDEKFFRTPEVLLALSLLSSIDNPRRDVYLAGLMCSPLYSFSPDELAFISCREGGTLYDSLVKYTEEHPEYERGASFLSELNRFRMLSEGMPTDELIAMLYKSTGLLALASRSGGKDNLMLLYESARQFESGSYRGLYNFLSYIHSILDRKNAFDKREAPTDPNAVRIITVHSSKGLEFPIVFFVGAEESFNRNHSAEPRYKYKEGFGIGMYARTPLGVALVENPTKAIIKEAEHRAKIEEEARVLYVALTRAKERLYVVATPTKKYDEFVKDVTMKREYLGDYSVYRLSSFLEFILCMKDFELKRVREFLGCEPEISAVTDYSVDKTGGEPSEHLPVTKDELVRRFTFKYPERHRSLLPEKVSVSRLYPDILDGTAEETLYLSGEGATVNMPLGITPAFIGGDDGISKKRGIATHKLLQFCDLDRLAEHGAEAEIRTLTEKKFLSMRDAELVRVKEVELFIRSRLLSDMRQARELYREFRFNVKLPARMFAEDERALELLECETLLVQGVIDCLILDSEGEYRLVDYKTDRLSGEELSDRTLAQRKLRDAHSRQLGYYAEAVKLIFGKYPKTVEVYSLPLGDTVDVKQMKG